MQFYDDCNKYYLMPPGSLGAKLVTADRIFAERVMQAYRQVELLAVTG